MVMNINEVTLKIKKAGGSKVRAVPMPGQDVQNGQYKIEINEDGNWLTILEGIPSKASADNIVNCATNRVLLG